MRKTDICIKKFHFGQIIKHPQHKQPKNKYKVKNSMGVGLGKLDETVVQIDRWKRVDDGSVEGEGLMRVLMAGG